jgi:hypothetical protein
MPCLILVKALLNLAIAASFTRHPPIALFFFACAVADGSMLWVTIKGFQ